MGRRCLGVSEDYCSATFRRNLPIRFAKSRTLIKEDEDKVEGNRRGGKWLLWVFEAKSKRTPFSFRSEVSFVWEDNRAVIREATNGWSD